MFLSNVPACKLRVNKMNLLKDIFKLLKTVIHVDLKTSLFGWTPVMKMDL